MSLKSGFALFQTSSILFNFTRFVRCCQIFWVKSDRTVCKFRKSKTNFCVVLTYSIKRAREIRKFHVAVVQQRLRKVQNSVMHVQSFFFANLNLLFLCCSPSPLQKLPTVVIQNFCYHGNVTSHFSLLNINLIFCWLLRRHIRTPRFDFLSPNRNKFHVRETLLVVNLQAKVAPSHIGANHLPSSKKHNKDSVGLNSLSEIKKKKIIIIKTDHNQQCPFQKTKQTKTEDFIFSHFHANFCTGRKRIQKGDIGKKMRFFFRNLTSVSKWLTM